MLRLLSIISCKEFIFRKWNWYFVEVYVFWLYTEIIYVLLWFQVTPTREELKVETAKDAEVIKLSESDVDNSNVNNDVLRKLLVSVITGPECPFC